MRQGFMIACLMLWVAINILGNIGEKQALMSQPNVVDGSQTLTQSQTLDQIMQPEMTDSNIVTIFSKLWNFLVKLGSIFVLWHPVLWHGSAIYIYQFIILPIGASFWVVFVLSMRGVGSS